VSQALTIKKVAEILDVEEKAVRRLVKGGALKSFKVGSQYRIWPEDLKEFSNQNATVKES
jgi:excisionase family DNA binding protein